jgi:hypothetical protein
VDGAIYARSATETDLDSQQSPEKRSPEPQLSKHSVLQNAIAKLAPTNDQSKKHLLNSEADPYPVTERVTSSSIVLTSNSQKSTSSSNYWQLVFVGVSIVLLGLGIGASVRAITAKTAIEPSSSASAPVASVENKTEKNTTATTKIAPSQISKVSSTSPSSPKANPSAIDSIDSSPALQNQEQVVTLEKFNRIQKGMSVEQVVKIFGASGKVIAENNSGNSIGQVYSWKNPEGSNAIIEFKDSQVVAKAQAGL